MSPETTAAARASATLKKLEPEAEAEIEEVGHLLDEISFNHIKHDVHEVANKVLRGTSKVLEFIKNVAELHPAAKAVVTAISLAVDLELTHQDNNNHIQVVYTTMAKTVFHMRFLNQLPPEAEKSMDQAMRALFSNIADTIRRFGQFLDAYQTHQWLKTAKVLLAHHHRSKLQDFDEQFQKHRREMDDMYKSVAHVQLTTVTFNTTEILRRLDRIRDPETEAAEEFIKQQGGADRVMMDPKLVDGVASRLGERATHGLKNILQAGWDVLMQRHAPVHDIKCRTRQALFTNPGALILMQMKDGPHELIEDQEFRDLWQNNNWRSMVKCRVFVEAIHEHYYRGLRTQAVAQDDHWTLDFFSRAMYHSAIGDIIDDDGSAHITVLELNAFLTAENRRRPHWTNPEWFAFWACGWYNNNAWYYGEINAMMRDLERSIEVDDISPPDDSWKTVKNILGSLKPLVLVADVEDFSGNIAVPPQLRRLQEEFRNFEESTISNRLQEFGVHLVDNISIMAIVGDARIELHMMPLLYVLTKRLRKLVKKVVEHMYIHHDEVAEIEEIATSCIAVFVAFDGRMRDLSRGWRFEAKNVELQIDRYADGLFKKYYHAPWSYHTPYAKLCDSIFGGRSRLPRHLQPVSRVLVTAPVNSMADVADRLKLLERHLAALDEKIGKLQALEDTAGSPDPAAALPSSPQRAQRHRAGQSQGGLFAVLRSRLRGLLRVQEVSSQSLKV